MCGEASRIWSRGPGADLRLDCLKKGFEGTDWSILVSEISCSEANRHVITEFVFLESVIFDIIIIKTCGVCGCQDGSAYEIVVWVGNRDRNFVNTVVVEVVTNYFAY